MTTPHHQSTSKKRLLSAHQKPKKSASPGSGPPIVPPDDQLLFPQKKTRDLPNLSDCHGCGFHINHTNPKDRLQTLDSVWRIVLLCRKCIKRVELGQSCSYCFKESANSECFKCRDCERLIHKVCVSKHEDSSPWSLCKSEKGLGLGLGLELSVCVDCWVPKMFRKSIRIRRRKKSWKISKKSRLNKSVGQKSGDRIPKDAYFLEKREIVLALRAPRKLLMKNPNKDEDGKTIEGDMSDNSQSGEDTSMNNAVGDVELAFQLHRAMNRSLRISKNSRLGVSKSGYVNGSSVEVGKLKKELITYKRRNPKKEFKTYKRGCLKRKRFLEIGGLDFSVGVAGNYSGDNMKMDSDSCFIQQDEALSKCDADDTKQGGISNEKTDRYMLKYSKRVKGCNSQIVSVSSRNENQTSAPEVPMNCSVESEVPMNCSIESKALSDASLNSSVVDLQGYASVADHQEKSPELNR